MPDIHHPRSYIWRRWQHNSTAQRWGFCRCFLSGWQMKQIYGLALAAPKWLESIASPRPQTHERAPLCAELPTRTGSRAGGTSTTFAKLTERLRWTAPSAKTLRHCRAAGARQSRQRGLVALSNSQPTGSAVILTWRLGRRRPPAGQRPSRYPPTSWAGLPGSGASDADAGPPNM